MINKRTNFKWMFLLKWRYLVFFECGCTLLTFIPVVANVGQRRAADLIVHLVVVNVIQRHAVLHLPSVQIIVRLIEI